MTSISLSNAMTSTGNILIQNKHSSSPPTNPQQSPTLSASSNLTIYFRLLLERLYVYFCSIFFVHWQDRVVLHQQVENPIGIRWPTVGTTYCSETWFFSEQMDRWGTWSLWVTIVLVTSLSNITRSTLGPYSNKSRVFHAVGFAVRKLLLCSNIHPQAVHTLPPQIFPSFLPFPCHLHQCCSLV